jgi:dihydroxyacetone kinase-like protein
VRRLAAGGGLLRQSSEQHLSIAAALDAACSSGSRAHAIHPCRRAKAAPATSASSIGHQDPGATSVMFMVQMLAAAAKE